jgi:hypothetical protein
LATWSRSLNPTVAVAVRSHNALGPSCSNAARRPSHGKVFVGETELSRAMTEHVLRHVDGAVASPAH